MARNLGSALPISKAASAPGPLDQAKPSTVVLSPLDSRLQLCRDMSSDPPKPGSGTKKKGGTKKGGTPKAGESKTNDAVFASLERKPELGMNPVGILTGYYGSRGERIKHTVHDGALKLPKDALTLLDEATEETGLAPADAYDLPGLDCVVRPSIDPSLDTIIITDIALERVAIPDPSAPPPPEMPEGVPAPQPKMVYVMRTKVENRTIARRPTVVSSSNVGEQAAAERIRGGGDVEEGALEIDADSPAEPPINGADQDPMEVDSLPAEPAAPPNPLAPPTDAPVHGESSNAQTSTSASTTAAVPASVVAPQASVALAAAISSAAPLPLPTNVLAPQPGAFQAAVIASSAPIASRTEQATVSQTGGTPQATVTPAPAPTPTADAPVPVTSQSSAPDVSKSDPEVSPKTAPSNGSIKVEAPPNVQTLSTKPEPRWELHRPGPNDEMVTPEDQITPKPAWYRKDGVADIERSMLPEWFDGSAAHRTPEAYVRARETILAISDTVSNRNVTSSMVRRSIVGDAGSLQRLRNFMSNWSLINEDAINDSAPTAPLLRENFPVPKQFDGRLRAELINAVVEQSSKRRKTAHDNSFIPIDWEEVALQVGNGASSSDCERNFLSMPIDVEESSAATDNIHERPITPEASHEAQKAFSEPSRDAARQEFLRELVNSCSPVVVSKATEAALNVTANLKEAQSGALLGLVASRAVEEAQNTEKELEIILSQLLDQRMKKLENRMAMMDDVESILEAEKVALELERRDLYTARCRHWFGGT